MPVSSIPDAVTDLSHGFSPALCTRKRPIHSTFFAE
jgi:hypothetical protein